MLSAIVNSLGRGLEKFPHTYTKAEIVVHILNSQSLTETECYMVKDECGHDPFQFFVCNQHCLSLQRLRVIAHTSPMYQCTIISQAASLSNVVYTQKTERNRDHIRL